jgi:hypothetical protein
MAGAWAPYRFFLTGLATGFFTIFAAGLGAAFFTGFFVSFAAGLGAFLAAFIGGLCAALPAFAIAFAAIFFMTGVFTAGTTLAAGFFGDEVFSVTGAAFAAGFFSRSVFSTVGACVAADLTAFFSTATSVLTGGSFTVLVDGSAGIDS